MTTALGIDLYTYVCDNKESDDIFKSFFLASVPELDGPTDIALAEVMYRAAAKYYIKYIFEGYSFNSEGVLLLQASYVDGRYIRDIHSKFGKLKMKTFPNMSFYKFLYWAIIRRIQRVRPFWYLPFEESNRKNI